MLANSKKTSRRGSAPGTRKASPSISEIRRLLSYLRPYRGQVFIAAVSLFFGTGLSLIFPWVMQTLVDAVFSNGDLQQLNRITLLLMIAFLVRAIFYYFQVYSLSYAGERIVTDLRRQIYAHIHDLSLRFFSDRRTGELISRLSSDVTLVRAALTNNVASVLSQGLTFLGSMALMVVLNWRLTLFILALAPLVGASAALFGVRLRRLSTEVQDRLAESASLAEEALSNVRVVKAFGREGFEVERYGQEVERTFSTTMRVAVWRSAFGPLISFLAFGALGGILWFGGREVLAARLTAGELIAFLVYGINIAAALGSFTSLYTQLQEALGAARRVFDLIDENPEILDAPQAHALESTQGALSLDHVSFAYPGTPNILKDINLQIQPGEVLALVGPSGAGKSTLFNLIPRFYDPSSGQILLDGYDLRELTIESLRSKIALVPQETQLFSGTVRENLRYGHLEASDAEIVSAARAANADEFIQNLPQGYDTLVGERGVKLSGGQRQRVAIARAILKNPRILLLDEATSSLDSESEILVQEALERLMQGRTTVIIAHRLSTIQRADRIAVLDAGELVELGTHSALLAQNGLYSRLYQLQFKIDSLA